MNRTIKNSRIKLTIFFVTSLFAMTLLIQATAYGQISPIVRIPRTVPVAAPTPKTTTIAKPGSRVIMTTIPNIRRGISKNLQPDLQITDITYNPTKCLVKIRALNSSTTDIRALKEADRVSLWINIVSVSGSKILSDSYLPVADRYWEWKANEEMAVEISLTEQNTTINEGWQPRYVGVCKFDDLKEVHAVVDARYLVTGDPYKEGIFAGDLIKPGAAVPYPWRVMESAINERDENNNELIVKKADMKLY